MDSNQLLIDNFQLTDVLFIIINEYLSFGERFPLLFVCKYFNTLIINDYKKIKIFKLTSKFIKAYEELSDENNIFRGDFFKNYFTTGKSLITKSTTPNLIEWYDSLFEKNKGNIHIIYIFCFGNLKLLQWYNPNYNYNQKIKYEYIKLAEICNNLETINWLLEYFKKNSDMYTSPSNNSIERIFPPYSVRFDTLFLR